MAESCSDKMFHHACAVQIAAFELSSRAEDDASCSYGPVYSEWATLCTRCAKPRRLHGDHRLKAENFDKLNALDQPAVYSAEWFSHHF
jgi:hypothetical protein